jgi:hypothetical protein
MNKHITVDYVMMLQKIDHGNITYFCRQDKLIYMVVFAI